MQLELSIKQLMQSQASAPSQNGMTAREAQQQPRESPLDPHHAAHDSTCLQNGTTSYVGSTHWSAILDDIHEIQTVLGGSVDLSDAEHPMPHDPLNLDGEVIFGASSTYSMPQIISQFLPSKVEVDRLLAIYFRGEAYVAPFIHTYQFQRQYREFWADTSRVNPLWLAQLFCICQMGTYVGQKHGGHSPQRDAGEAQSRFHAAAAQCLVVGKYHQPQRFAPEALGLYAQCKNIRSLDASREMGPVLGMAVRIAYQMGYHRDPDVLGSFSVFEGEMRRRAWSSCKQMDMMISFQLGLPSNICLDNCDTRSPRNLFNTDFDEDTQVLPPSRPESEVTPLLWYFVKDRQMVNFSKVCRIALSFHEASEADIVQLDYEIRETHRTTPDVLRTRPLCDSIADPPFLIMTRLFIEFIHLKSLCVLHRRYMARGSVFSTKCCLEAATKLVGHFIEVDREFSPGGQLYLEGWMLTSFTMNDFLLGVMMLCLFLHMLRKKGARHLALGNAQELEVRALLERSHAICVEKSPASKDALRVARVIHLTLHDARLIRAPADVANGHATPISIPASGHAPSNLGETPETDLMSLSLDARQNGAGSNDAVLGLLDPFSFTSTDLGGIDWSEFDREIFGEVVA